MPENQPESTEVLFTFDGEAIPARAGQTVGGALTDAGIKSWRATRFDHRPRGLFCGIGVCFDCLLTIDGRPNQRACLVTVRDGLACGSGGVTGVDARG
ncbi:(2Fe-2S)-binding protein [Mycobacterium sp. 141]|uniref:(2Fe-2S)-binding protein n=1 Tax=Mycobacterium sp. 141 TaxID=1120797 RepID=UPI00035C4E94|nr:(2Fe-2S)-binding protein [Mycobacterium sp. 141]